MIIGLGLDMANIPRFERALARRGDAFLRRVCTDAETAEIMARPRPAAALAMRWAAKEAFSKAAGTGMKGMSFSEIEVVHEPSGKPGLALHGRAKAWAQAMGEPSAYLSLTDDGEYAAAVVVLEKL